MTASRRPASKRPPPAALRILAKDPVMARIIRRAQPFKLSPENVPTPFQALVRAIAHQQLNGTAAQTILGRVHALFPNPRRLDPVHCKRLPHARLRGAGLSNAKTLAVKDLAAKALDGTVPGWAALRKLSDDQIVERLTEVRGVGRWTVEMLLIFQLGRLDVLPVDDYGVRKGFQRAYRKRQLPTPKELAAFGERWRPYRSVASWYLWRAVELPA